MGLVRSSWKTQTLARSDKNLLASSAATIQKKSTNGLLVSRALRIQRVLVLHRHHAEHCSNKQNNATNDTNNVIYLPLHIPLTLFISASSFCVTALSVDRFLAIYLHLRYQELVTSKRVAAVVVSIWVTSALISLIRLFIPKNIMYVSFVIIISACIITATSLSVKLYLTLRRHINKFQVQQVAQNDQVERVQRKKKSAVATLYVYLVFIVCYLPNICVNYYR